MRKAKAPRLMRFLRRGAEHMSPGRALTQADELFEQGCVVEAIEFLTAANRARRDPRIERRLVSMRYDAFRRAQWPAVPPSVPDAVDDLFPGAVIPEVRADELDIARVRSGLLNHGSLIVRGLLGPEAVERLTADIDRAFERYGAWESGDDPAAGEPWFEPFERAGTIERRFLRKAGGVLAADSPPALFDVIEAFDAAGVRTIVSEFFGEPPALLAKKWTLRLVPHDIPATGWHQDGAFMGGDIRSLNVWLALSHCGDTAPGLDVVARRFDGIVPSGGAGAAFTWSVGTDVIDEGSVVRPVFEPGDALIFDHLNLHRTAADPAMTHDRYAIEAWFLAPSTYPLMVAGEGAAGSPPRDQWPMIY